MNTTENYYKSRILSRLVQPILLGLALIVVAIVGLLIIPVEDTQARETLQISTQAVTKTAYVVVRYGDNDVVVRRINFTGIISGWRALELAGLNPSGPDPSSLASINGYGNPDSDPFGNTRYWVTYHMSGTAWAFNAWGVAEPKISENGHVEGFSWSGLEWNDPGPPPPMGVVAAADGLQWLHSQQSDTDGGYGNASKSIETLIAVGANGCDPAEWRNGDGNPSLLAYLSQDLVANFADDAAGAGKAAVALAAAQQVVTDYLGLNLVISITTHYSDTEGSYSTGAGGQTWAMMGLVAGQQTVPVTASDYLTGLMKAEGCWEWEPGFGCDTNTTALAIQALLASGVPTDSAVVISGVTWLKSAQNNDGGFPYDPQSAWGTESDTNSTTYVLQSLLAVREDLSMLTYGTPVDYLLSMQQTSGQFYWQGSSAGMDSQSPARQAVPPLLDRPFPTSSVAGLTTCSLNDKAPNYYYLPVIYKN